MHIVTVGATQCVFYTAIEQKSSNPMVGNSRVVVIAIGENSQAH
jgi:hypothetical protein